MWGLTKRRGRITSLDLLDFFCDSFSMYSPDIREGNSREISGRVLQIFKANILSFD